MAAWSTAIRAALAARFGGHWQARTTEEIAADPTLAEALGPSRRPSWSGSWPWPTSPSSTTATVFSRPCPTPTCAGLAGRAGRFDVAVERPRGRGEVEDQGEVIRADHRAEPAVDDGQVVGEEGVVERDPVRQVGRPARLPPEAEPAVAQAGRRGGSRRSGASPRCVFMSPIDDPRAPRPADRDRPAPASSGRSFARERRCRDGRARDDAAGPRTSNVGMENGEAPGSGQLGRVDHRGPLAEPERQPRRADRAPRRDTGYSATDRRPGPRASSGVYSTRPTMSGRSRRISRARSVVAGVVRQHVGHQHAEPRRRRGSGRTGFDPAYRNRGAACNDGQAPQPEREPRGACGRAPRRRSA